VSARERARLYFAAKAAKRRAAMTPGERARAAAGADYYKTRKLLDACESCGATGNLHGHHASYAPDMLFAVTTLCCRCHMRLHREFANAGRPVVYRPRSSERASV
jgi:hypothetical protein